MTARDDQTDDVDVVVVGAGPVGSALAIDLAMAGVRTILLESRAQGERPHPGTNLTNMRSMEHLRRWGATEAVRAANTVGAGIERDAVFATRGTGHVVATIPEAFADMEPLPFASATPHFGPQASVERGLQARLGELPAAELRFDVQFERFEQDDDEVRVTYRDAGGGERTVRGAYLVGADGAGSLVRKQLGIRMEGTRDLVRGSAWYIRSPDLGDLLAEHLGRPAITWFVNDDAAGTLLIAQGPGGHYQYMEVPLDDDVDGGDWEQMRARLYRCVGAEVPVEPLEGGGWRINSLVAPRFHDDRVFLAGEAAHHISVFGAFGMNTGVGDVAELGWKLTAAVRGWAGPGLLESYSAERVPFVRWVRDLTEQTTEHLGAYRRPGLEDSGPEGDALRETVGGAILESKRQEVVSVGAQFGAAYTDSPVVAPDGTRPPMATFGEFVPSASPGSRAPHLWLGEGRSLFDEIAHEGFTLLRLTADADSTGLESAARDRGVPLRVVDPGDDRLPDLYEAALALVRPDHHVAWRGSAPPADPLAVIDTVRGGDRTVAATTSARAPGALAG